MATTASIRNNTNNNNNNINSLGFFVVFLEEHESVSVYNFGGNKQTKQNIFFCLCRFSMSPQVHVKHALKITCSCKSSETPGHLREPSIQSDLLDSTLLSVSVVFYYNTTASVSLGLLWQHRQNSCDVIRMRHNTTVEDIEALVYLLPNRCQVSAPHHRTTVLVCVEPLSLTAGFQKWRFGIL